MKSEIKILADYGYNDYREIPYDLITFPCGEIQVRLNVRKDILGSEDIVNVSSAERVIIETRIKDSDGIMALMQIKKILDMWHAKQVDLFLGYLPYARQDRACVAGECCSLKVFANLINSLDFNVVIIADPHSDVAPQLFNNCMGVFKSEIFSGFKEKLNLDSYTTLVAPDYGASKEVEKLAMEFGKEFIQGYKKRDLTTGELSGFGYHGDIEGKRLLVVDDICDGGGTFLGLGQELAFGAPQSIALYVTHGCFTQGTDKLKDTFSKIYSGNTYHSIKSLQNMGVQGLKVLSDGQY